MRTYSMVFLDIDGTLLDANDQVSPCTRKLLKHLEKRGISVILCSARSPAAIEPVSQQAGICGPIICYNGSLILSTDRSILFDQGMRAEDAIRFKEFADSAFPEVNVSTYLYNVWLVDSAQNQHICREAGRSQHEPLEGLLRSAVQSVPHVHKQLCMGAPLQILQLQERAMREFPMMDFLRSGPIYLEVTAKGVSKRSAVEKLHTLYMIDREETVACGDNFVDLEMLRYAGLGIAMGNAPEEVKRAADMVTASNLEDGVYIALKNLRFKQNSQVKTGEFR